MKTQTKSNFENHVRRAQSALDGGDSGVAVDFLRSAEGLAPGLDALKAVQKAGEEAECGSVERAEAILETLAITFAPNTSDLTKHTPGPWAWRHVYQDGSTAHAALLLESQADNLPHGDPLVLAVREDTIRGLDGLDAHLIAAAPELLEALETAKIVCAVALTWESSAKFRKHLDAVIAKAKGQP